MRKHIGICHVTTRDVGLTPDGNGWPILRTWYREAGLDLIKVQMPHWGTSDPRDVMDAIEDGAKVAILCTTVVGERHGDGYDWRWVSRRLLEPNGSGKSYWEASQFAQQRGAQVIIEVGNEPDLEGMDPALASRLTIEVVEKLRNRFPGVKWICSMPTLFRYYDVFLTDQLLRVVDGVGTHVYVYRDLFQEVAGDHHEWSRIYRRLLSDARVKEVWITEIGVNDIAIPYTVKAAQCYRWLQQQPEKVRGAAWFTVGKPGRWNREWDGFCLHEREHILALGGKLGGNVSGGAVPAGARVFRETGHWINGEIRRFWEDLERRGLALPLIGYPLSRPFETTLDGKRRLVQLFERCALVVEPEHAPPWRVHPVLLRDLQRIMEEARRVG